MARATCSSQEPVNERFPRSWITARRLTRSTAAIRATRVSALRAVDGKSWTSQSSRPRRSDADEVGLTVRTWASSTTGSTASAMALVMGPTMATTPPSTSSPTARRAVSGSWASSRTISSTRRPLMPPEAFRSSTARVAPLRPEIPRSKLRPERPKRPPRSRPFGRRPFWVHDSGRARRFTRLRGPPEFPSGTSSPSRARSPPSSSPAFARRSRREERLEVRSRIR